MGKTNVNPLQKIADKQYCNQNSKNIRKEQNHKKTHGNHKGMSKQGGALPNLSFHKNAMI